MCGLAGLLAPPGTRPDRADLLRMSATLAHRGPDSEGLHLDDEVGLAHRRLAILDLSPAGAQPMTNEDGSVVVAYNGQLYGFQPLRERLEDGGHRFRSHTDTEVLVHLYEERGESLVDEIDGMFAFALWDAKRHRLLLARDRLGIKPLYYIEHEGFLAFASELKALLALPWLPRDPDREALVQFLYQSSVPGESCALLGYHKLLPGQLLVAENGRVRTRSYWQPPRHLDDRVTLDEAAEELDERLSAAVRSHLVADVPVGAFLSGGLDSTAVVLHARAAMSAPLHTFSVSFAGPQGVDEGPAARAVAQALGTEHHELALGPEALDALPEVVRLCDEPFAISSALALHALSRLAREHVKVVLTGDGADEILGGYPWRHAPETGAGRLRALGMVAVRSQRGARAGGPGLPAQLTGRLRRMAERPADRYAEIICAFTPEEMEALLLPGLRELSREAWENLPLRRRFGEEPAGDETNRRLRVDVATSLVDEMLTKVDRMTMSCGLEARVPFLDRELVEWSLRLPGKLKVSGGTGKLPLRKALERKLPDTARRRKHGFDVPLGDYLRGRLAPWLRDSLSPDRVKRRGLLRPEAVERLVEAHLSGKVDASRRLLSLLVLDGWLDGLAG